MRFTLVTLCCCVSREWSKCNSITFWCFLCFLRSHTDSRPYSFFLSWGSFAVGVLLGQTWCLGAKQWAQGVSTCRSKNSAEPRGSKHRNNIRTQSQKHKIDTNIKTAEGSKHGINSKEAEQMQKRIKVVVELSALLYL